MSWFSDDATRDAVNLGVGATSLGIGIVSLALALNTKPGKKRRRKGSFNITGAELERHKKVPLSKQGYEGIYVTSDGRVVEMHEWENPDWYGDSEDEWGGDYEDNDGKPPVGSIYYDTFDRDGPLDGGVMGYDENDDLSAFEQFESSPLVALVLTPDDPGYEDLLEALEDGRYDDVRDVYGLPNRKPRRRLVSRRR